MLKVGLTGGIGSGKTTVARIFSGLGVPVFFADLEARNLMESSEEIIHSIKSYFGEEVYNGSELNRKFLANVVFNDPVKLKKLNQLIHPAVHKSFESWTREHREVTYLVEEAALLCETEAYKYFDYLVLVTAPCNKRIERVMLRDSVTEEEVRSRMKSQMPDEEKIPLAHFLIFNDDENMLVNQVLAFHEKMISLNKK
jgi:dephospho-CoA kinase